MRTITCLSALALAACGAVEPDFTDAGVDDDPTPMAYDTVLESGPPALGNQDAVTIEFRSEPAGASFECRVDDGAPEPCTSPLALVVAEGAHAIEIAALGDEGPDPTPAAHTWVVDLTPPETSFVAAPPALDNSPSVTFELAATEPATFACALDGGDPAPCTSPWAIAGLGDGAHQVEVVATDAAGNVEPTPAGHAWSIDTDTPDTQITAGPQGAVASTSAQLAFTSDDAGPGATFACALDGAAFAACTSPVALAALAQGEHVFEVRVADAVGNVDPTPASRRWIVDTVAPSVTITAGPEGPVADTTPTFSMTTEPGATLACRVDLASAAPCTSPWTLPALAQGNHVFRVVATDEAGNASPEVLRNFTVDTITPVVTITSGPDEDELWLDDQVTFGFTVSDTTPTVRECRIYRIGQAAPAYAACTSPRLYNLGGGSSIVEYRFQVRATDAVGLIRTVTRNFRQAVPEG